MGSLRRPQGSAQCCLAGIRDAERLRWDPDRIPTHTASSARWARGSAHSGDLARSSDADPAGLMARARLEARPEVRAANLSLCHANEPYHRYPSRRSHTRELWSRIIEENSVTQLLKMLTKVS